MKFQHMFKHKPHIKVQRIQWSSTPCYINTHMNVQGQTQKKKNKAKHETSYN